MLGVALASWLFGCQRAADPEPQPAPEAQPATTAKADLTQVREERGAELPALEQARLAYLFEAAQRVALTWPRLSAEETCILLVGQTAQWVVNCERAPPGFERIGARFRKHPIFTHDGRTFEVSGELRSTAELLARTPAAAHVVHPSQPHGGLPGPGPWLMLGTLEALRAFHPAFGPATTESWLSVAMHELIHVHQLRQPSFEPWLARLDDLAKDSVALTELYVQDPWFRDRVRDEYQQLVAAVEAEAAPLPSLRRWLRAYRDRSAWLAARPGGAALALSERLFTYLEGVARFVESDFLANVAQHPPGGLEQDPQFSQFRAFVGRGYGASPNRQLDDQYYYAIGYHLCVLLERLDPSWKTRVHTEPGWLIGLVERTIERRARGDRALR